MRKIVIGGAAHRKNDDVGGFYPFAVRSMLCDGRYRKDRD